MRALSLRIILHSPNMAWLFVTLVSSVLYLFCYTFRRKAERSGSGARYRTLIQLKLSCSTLSRLSRFSVAYSASGCSFDEIVAKSLTYKG